MADSPMVQYVFTPKERSWFMRLLGWLLRWSTPRFMTDFWTTLGSRIYYPSSVAQPWLSPHRGIVEHELVHVRQFRDWGWLAMAALYLFFPLPILFSGRWFIERPAYLLDIRAGRMTPQEAVDTLWQSYLWPWPRKRMLEWFQKESGTGGSDGAKRRITGG